MPSWPSSLVSTWSGRSRSASSALSPCTLLAEEVDEHALVELHGEPYPARAAPLPRRSGRSPHGSALRAGEGVTRHRGGPAGPTPSPQASATARSTRSLTRRSSRPGRGRPGPVAKVHSRVPGRRWPPTWARCSPRRARSVTSAAVQATPATATDGSGRRSSRPAAAGLGHGRRRGHAGGLGGRAAQQVGQRRGGIGHRGLQHRAGGAGHGQQIDDGGHATAGDGEARPSWGWRGCARTSS